LAQILIFFFPAAPRALVPLPERIAFIRIHPIRANLPILHVQDAHDRFPPLRDTR